MNIYLAIITTALVITQIIRVIQNALNLKLHDKAVDEQLKAIGDVTKEDLERQKKAFKYIVKYFETQYHMDEDEEDDDDEVY